MSQDLFNNPMVTSAKNSLTLQQIDEYKRMGEYMYNSVDYKNISKVTEAKETDLILYATESLKSGLDPKELTKQELEVLERNYGEKWYEKFDLNKDDLPVFSLTITPEQVLNSVEDKIDKMNLSKSQVRSLKRKIAKQKQLLKVSK